MKKFLIVQISILSFFAFGFVSFSNLAAISKALSEGNVDALEQYLDKQVEISILDKEDIYGKDEAVKVLKDFFSKNKPSAFSQVHQGASKGQDSQYCIGNLVANSGTFRVYIYLKVVNGKHLIQELRFDKE